MKIKDLSKNMLVLKLFVKHTFVKYILPHKDQVSKAFALLYAGPSVPLHYSFSKKRDEKRPSSLCPNIEGKGKVLLFSH